MPARIPYRFCPRCGTALVTLSTGDRERVACASTGCDFVHWDNPVPVVAAIVEHDGAVILANDRAWPEDMFGLVTGFLESGEEPGAGVVREVREELGLAGEIVELVGIYPFARLNQVIMAWHVRATGELRLGEELRAVRRVAPEKLRPWEFGTGPAVRDWLQRRGRRAS